jgi:glycosyltransferase involved in cell wall biosynthesis
MRLGLVIYGSLETLSGGYLYDRELVAHLRQVGDEVTVITLPWRSYAQHLGDNLSPALARRLRHLQVDLLLEDELNHPSLACMNRRLRQVVDYPLVSIVHHLRSSEQHPAILRWFYQQIERSYLRGVDGFIFNSRTTQAEAAGLSGRAVQGVVAFPGGNRFGPGVDEAAIMARAQQPGSLRLLFVGNLIERKGLHTLLQALLRLPAAGWELNIVGRQDVDRAYSARTAAFVKRHALDDRVYFWGQLPEGGLRQLWASSHALVVPSQYEGFGIVYLEGMSFGLPAIASTAGAASEIIEDGQQGYLVPSGDPIALAERLSMWIGDRDRLARMSIAARCRFDSFPSWEESMSLARSYLKGLVG